MMRYFISNDEIDMAILIIKLQITFDKKHFEGFGMLSNFSIVFQIVLIIGHWHRYD